MSDVGDTLIEGLKEAVAHAKGKKTGAKMRTVMVHVPDQIDVAAIRKGMGLKRPDFAARFGFSVRTLEKWEAGLRQPDGAARAYLLVIKREPAAVERALQVA